MTQKTSKRTASTLQASGPSLHGIFRRWLVAGLLAVAFYLMAVLINTAYVKTYNSIDTQSGVIVSLLIILAIVSAIWWLIESARGSMLYISRHSTPAPKKKTTSRKK